MSIENVIWDMGGVFRRYFTEILVDEGLRRGWPLERMSLGPTGVADDPEYRLMCEGKMDEPDYLLRVISYLQAEGIEFDPIRDPDWEIERRPEVWKLIDEIAESDITQVILTNDATRWMGEQWWETWSDRHRFDAIIDVTTVGARKPDEAPYRITLDRIGAPPGACLFVDDMPVNCRTAASLGMEVQWFDITRPDASVRALRESIGL